MITAKSYFSGAGGMDYGICEAGINIIRSYNPDADRSISRKTGSNFDFEDGGNMITYPRKTGAKTLNKTGV